MTSKYTIDAQQNLMSIVEFLAGKILKKTSIQQLVDGVGLKRDVVFRALQNLVDRGWVEDDNGYRLGPVLVRFSEQFRVQVVGTLEVYLGGGDDEKK